MIPRIATAALTAGAALVTLPALAHEGPITPASAIVAYPIPEQADPPDMVSASQPAATPQDVNAQIAHYLATSPAMSLPADGDSGVIAGDELDRKVHGVVSAAVGSHGYRDFYVRSDFPVGKTGTLSIALGKTQGRRLYGYGHSSDGLRAYAHGPGGRQSFSLAFSSSDKVYGGGCRYNEEVDHVSRLRRDCRAVRRGDGL